MTTKYLNDIERRNKVYDLRDKLRPPRQAARYAHTHRGVSDRLGFFEGRPGRYTGRAGQARRSADRTL